MKKILALALVLTMILAFAACGGDNNDQTTGSTTTAPTTAPSTAPTTTTPVKPGRNLAVVIEIAAMNNRQKRMGYNTAEEFNKKRLLWFIRRRV